MDHPLVKVYRDATSSGFQYGFCSVNAITRKEFLMVAGRNPYGMPTFWLLHIIAHPSSSRRLHDCPNPIDVLEFVL